MATPVEIAVFSDYLCPWCWPAAVHLKRLREEFGTAVRVIHKAFLLRPADAKREFSAYHLQHRVAAESASGLPFHVPRAGHGEAPRGPRRASLTRQRRGGFRSRWQRASPSAARGSPWLKRSAAR